MFSRNTFFLPSLLVWFRNVFLHEPCMSPLPSPGVLCRMDSVQGLSSFPVNTDVKMGSHCLRVQISAGLTGKGQKGSDVGVWCSAPPASLPRPALSHCTAHWQCLFCWSHGLLFTTGLKTEPVFQGLLEIPSQMQTVLCWEQPSHHLQILHALVSRSLAIKSSCSKCLKKYLVQKKNVCC